MGTGKIRLSYFLSILRDAVIPVVSVASLGLAFGMQGVEAGIVLSGVLTMGACFLIPEVLNSYRFFTYFVPLPEPTFLMAPVLTLCPRTASIVAALTSGSIFPISWHPFHSSGFNP